LSVKKKNFKFNKLLCQNFIAKKRGGVFRPYLVLLFIIYLNE